jgi:hypothetical protein
VHVTPRITPVYDTVLASVNRSKVPIRAGSADLKVTVSVVWSFA